MRAAMPSLAQLASLLTAPITAVHLWFDRPISPLSHAVLVGRASQWIFFDRATTGNPPAHYCQAVISASHVLIGRTRQEILAIVRQDLESVWLAARGAALLHWRAITHRSAVFSPRAGIDQLRPPQRTPIPNLFLAGDWTATGWPVTMESAVRSGYLAVEAMLLA
jgi:uncharacterized protein with NAD-binding domain and iron-sulfur cluster